MQSYFEVQDAQFVASFSFRDLHTTCNDKQG